MPLITNVYYINVRTYVKLDNKNIIVGDVLSLVS